MLNSTKTWQEEFDEEFIDSETSDIDGKTDYYLNDKANEVLPLKQFISDLIAQTREETIRAVEERLPKAQKINKKDWLGLNYTLGDVKYREHQYSLLVLDILNKLKK